MEEMRLQKYLSQSGVCSRREAERYMKNKRVKVNGTICTEMGTKVRPGKDRVEVDGKVIEPTTSYTYVAINKPQGMICSMDDPEGRPIVSDLLPKNMPRIWPVGRLDWDSEGLLLMTNDGELTNLLTHPSHEVEKTYAVKVQGMIPTGSKQVTQLREGVELEDGEVTEPATVMIGGDTGNNTWLEFRITEGRNRQIRRMCEAVGFRVMRLRRIQIGPIALKGISSESFRSLSHAEVYELYRACGAPPPGEAEPSRRAVKKSHSVTRGGRTKKTRSSGRSSRKSHGKPK